MSLQDTRGGSAAGFFEKPYDIKEVLGAIKAAVGE
jgi:hypothetical protein